MCEPCKTIKKSFFSGTRKALGAFCCGAENVTSRSSTTRAENTMKSTKRSRGESHWILHQKSHSNLFPIGDEEFLIKEIDLKFLTRLDSYFPFDEVYETPKSTQAKHKSGRKVNEPFFANIKFSSIFVMPTNQFRGLTPWLMAYKTARICYSTQNALLA